MKRISAALKNYIVDAVALFVLGLAMVLWSDAAIGTIFKGTGIGLLALGAIKAIGYFLKIRFFYRFFPDCGVSSAGLWCHHHDYSCVEAKGR